MKKLLVVCGPTAVGKTDLALQLAKKFHGEIVSSDSRQVYKGMDIGTGKDLPVNSKLIPHSAGQNSKLQIKNKKFTVGYRNKEKIPIWLVDIVNPDYIFNVGEYTRLAKGVIDDIWSRQKLPILVGGTGLYIKSLIEPLFLVSVPRSTALRNQLEKLDRNQLAEMLKKENPEKWKTMNYSDKLNARRLIRAIEITQYQKEHDVPKVQNSTDKMEVFLVGLKTEKEELWKRIDRRVEERIKKGAEKEVINLLRSGYSFKNSVLGVTIGYKEWEEYLENTDSKEAVYKKWKHAEHAYARRQMTWFRKQKDIHWFDITHPPYREKIEQRVTKWYTAGSDALQSRNII